MKRIISFILICAMLTCSLSILCSCKKTDEKSTPEYTIISHLAQPDIKSRALTLTVEDARLLYSLFSFGTASEDDAKYNSFDASIDFSSPQIEFLLSGVESSYSMKSDLSTVLVNDGGSESEWTASEYLGSDMADAYGSLVKNIRDAANIEKTLWAVLTEHITPQRTQVPEGVKLEYALSAEDAAAVLSALSKKDIALPDFVSFLCKTDTEKSLSETLEGGSFGASIRITLDNLSNAPLIIDITAKYKDRVFSLVYDGQSKDTDITLKTKNGQNGGEDVFSLLLKHGQKTSLTLTNEAYTASDTAPYLRKEELRLIEDDETFYISYTDTAPDGATHKNEVKLTHRGESASLSFETAVDDDTHSLLLTLSPTKSENSVTYTAVAATTDEKDIDISSLGFSLTLSEKVSIQ